MRSPEAYIALRDWADESARHAADEQGVEVPSEAPHLGGAETLHLAAELLWLAHHDFVEFAGRPESRAALSALRDASTALAEHLAESITTPTKLRMPTKVNLREVALDFGTPDPMDTWKQRGWHFVLTWDQDGEVVEGHSPGGQVYTARTAGELFVALEELEATDAG